MNFTDIYRKIYSFAKTDQIPHELAHSVSVRITDVITELYTYVKENCPDKLDEIGKTINDFWLNKKLGGYDLDDKN